MVIVGLGAASILARFLVRAGYGQLTLLDSDRTSVSNWPRQDYTRAEVTATPPSYKVFALARRLLDDAPGALTVTAHALTLQDAHALGIDLSGSLAVCLVDNDPTPIAAHRIFAPLGMPILYAGFARTAGRGYVLVEERRDNAPCIGCAFPSKIDSDKYFPCASQSADLPLLAAGFLLYAAGTLVMRRPRAWNYREFGLANGAFDVASRWEKTPDCPLCGEHP